MSIEKFPKNIIILTNDGDDTHVEHKNIGDIAKEQNRQERNIRGNVGDQVDGQQCAVEVRHVEHQGHAFGILALVSQQPKRGHRPSHRMLQVFAILELDPLEQNTDGEEGDAAGEAAHADDQNDGGEEDETDAHRKERQR